LTSPDTLIVVVDHSAEVYARDLVHQFSMDAPDWHFFGVGGDLMAAAGVELIEHSRDIGVVGILEVASSLLRLKRLQTRILDECRQRKVKNAILVDYPDFNLRLAKKLTNQGIRVYHYISPTVWAWRPGRIETIRRYIRHLFLIFPFEEALYKKTGVGQVTFVGHPLLSRIRPALDRTTYLQTLGLPPQTRLIALLPGSRLSEVQRHLPRMLAALQIMKQGQHLQPIILKADSIPESALKAHFCPKQPEPIIVPQEQAYSLIPAADIVLTTCGTATLEIALLGTPFVVVYRVNPVSYLLGRKLIRINRFSIVNIMAEQMLVPELIQRDMSPESIAHELDKLLASPKARTAQIKGFEQLRSMLQAGIEPAKRITDIILRDQDPGLGLQGEHP
jgi:lipid-A-disaccharide synthase